VLTERPTATTTPPRTSSRRLSCKTYSGRTHSPTTAVSSTSNATLPSSSGPMSPKKCWQSMASHCWSDRTSVKTRATSSITITSASLFSRPPTTVVASTKAPSVSYARDKSSRLSSSLRPVVARLIRSVLSCLSKKLSGVWSDCSTRIVPLLGRSLRN